MTMTNTQMILAEATDLLTPAAERLLFKALRDAKMDVVCLERMRNKSLNWYSQLSAAKRRVKRLKTEIVRANLPLVIRIARRMNCPGITVEEFVSEGLLKLLQCIDAFKVEKGYKFSTYLYRPLYRHFHRLMLKEARRNAGRVNGDSVFHSQETLEDTDEVDNLIEVLDDNTAGLDAMEKTIVTYFYGIGRDQPMTLKELSKHFGFSTGRLKKELARAVGKLRHVLEEK